METTGCSIRRATPDDANLITEQRIRMFIDTRLVSAKVEASLRAVLPDQLRSMLETGQYAGWLLQDGGGATVGGAGVVLRRLLPRVETQIPCEALVVNVYIAPEHRSDGLARRLMETILAWVREQGIERVVLHASSMGRPLYESLGFLPTSEMVLNLTANRAAE